ncbi:hypothetical protein AKJ16_DCAP12195 [Drosera capensis]
MVRANLVKLGPEEMERDKRGWILDPVGAAIEAGVSGGAVNCVSVHVGEIRPGGIRGNYRHYTCNETFVIWGAKTKFRLENSEIGDKGYAEAVVGEDEVAVAASPSGTSHALVNIDPVRTTLALDIDTRLHLEGHLDIHLDSHLSIRLSCLGIRRGSDCHTPFSIFQNVDFVIVKRGKRNAL